MATPTGWRLTTMDWLSEHYPEYVASSLRSSSAGERLRVALAAMSYKVAAWERARASVASGDSGVVPEPGAAREFLVERWDAAEHSALVEWLKSGGYMGEVGRRETEHTLKGTAEDKVEDLGHPQVFEREMTGTVPGTFDLSFLKLQKIAKEAARADQELEDLIQVVGNPAAGGW